MPSNLIGDTNSRLIYAGRLGADRKINDLVETGRLISLPMGPGIGPHLDENDTDWPIFPGLLAIGPLIIETNDHARFRCRQLLAQAVT